MSLSFSLWVYSKTQKYVKTKLFDEFGSQIARSWHAMCLLKHPRLISHYTVTNTINSQH